MAAPVKAFIDPTTLAKFMASPINISVYGSVKLFPPTEPITRFVEREPFTLVYVITKGDLTRFASPVFPKVPEPPMGRQLIVTFPSIYRDFDARANMPKTPRIHPPIIISSNTNI